MFNKIPFELGFSCIRSDCSVSCATATAHNMKNLISSENRTRVLEVTRILTPTTKDHYFFSQCDQMGRLFVKYLPICINENSLHTIQRKLTLKVGQSCEFCQIWSL